MTISRVIILQKSPILGAPSLMVLISSNNRYPENTSLRPLAGESESIFYPNADAPAMKTRDNHRGVRG
jgi:hypothetical protein